MASGRPNEDASAIRRARRVRSSRDRSATSPRPQHPIGFAMVLAAAPSSLRLRSALVIARAAYDELLERVRGLGDTSLARVAEAAHARGSRVIADLAVGPDLMLAEDAADAFGAYMSSLRTDDPDSMLMWLSMLPDALREIVHGAGWQDAPSIQVRPDTKWPDLPEREPPSSSSRSEDGFRRLIGGRRRALAA
jgi:hypothetical protein